MSLTEELKAELKAKANGAEMAHLDFGEGFEFVVKAPPYVEYQRFMAAVLDTRGKETAPIVLTESCIVWPELSVARPKLQRKPFLYQKISDVLAEMMGNDLELKKSVF